MELHANAALSLVQRRKLVELVPVVGVVAAAEAVGTTPTTGRKWWRRWQEAGEAGLRDRSSRPHSSPNQTSPARVDVICKLRLLRFSGPTIAEILAMPISTVSAVLTREGMGRLGRLGLEPPRRFEVSEPGEVIHLDVKKLGRITRGPGHRAAGRGAGTNRPLTRRDAAGVDRGTAGWDAVHVAIDGYSRLAYAEVLADETAATTIGFLGRALAFYKRHGITAQRVHTDNGSAYVSTAFRVACGHAGLRHSRSPAYHPQTNGKAERFIRTMLGGWAYAAVYGSSTERARALNGWLERYNYRRPHAALNGQPPGNNVPGPYT
jgi:transposase InsO family protein